VDNAVDNLVWAVDNAAWPVDNAVDNLVWPVDNAAWPVDNAVDNLWITVWTTCG
jgi:hypothetical protein